MVPVKRDNPLLNHWRYPTRHAVIHHEATIINDMEYWYRQIRVMAQWTKPQHLNKIIHNLLKYITQWIRVFNRCNIQWYCSRHQVHERAKLRYPYRKIYFRPISQNSRYHFRYQQRVEWCLSERHKPAAISAFSK